MIKNLKITNKKMFYKNLFLFFLCFSFFLGIGYAQIANINLEIDGTASLLGQSGVVISDVHYLNSAVPSQDTVTINTYYQTMFSSHVTLGNTSSNYVSLQVTINNLTAQKYIFDEAFYDKANSDFYSNLNIVPTLSGITENTTILNGTGESGNSTTFTVNFSYLDLSNITSTTLDGIINFHFTPLRQITYVNCTSNSGGLTSEYIRSDSYTNMNNVTYSPTVTISNAPSSITITDSSNNVLVSGTDYTYTSGVVTFLTEIESDLTITAAGGTGTSTSQVITNNDGSTTTITTQVVNGQEIVTGYNIDTTNVQGGITVPTGGIDSGVLVFDGYDFEATLEATFTFSQITSAYTVINMTANENSDMHGIVVLISRATSGMGNPYNESNTQIGSVNSNNPAIKFRYNKYENNKVDNANSQDFFSSQGNIAYSSSRFGTKSTTFTLIFKIKKENGIFSVEIQNQSGTTVARPKNSTTFSFNSIANDVTFEIGHWKNLSGNDSTCPMKVVSFDIVKTIN